MMVFTAEHNVLMHPFHLLGVIGMFGAAIVSAVHGQWIWSLVNPDRSPWSPLTFLLRNMS